jgi:hypothetical protein
MPELRRFYQPVAFNDVVTFQDWTVTKTDTAAADQAVTLTFTNSATSGSTSYEPFLLTTTLTGAGQVGGRAKFKTTFSAALGGWANALKAEVAMDTDGSVSGLGSAFVAEMTMPAAALALGTYGVVEVELNCPTTWSGTVPVSFFYLSANGNTVDNFHDYGYLFDIQGLGSATTGEIFQANTAADATHALRIRIGATPYYIMLTSTGA